MSETLLRVESIDRLDEQWVSDHPVFRVTFWSLPLSEGDGAQYPSAFNSEHWRLFEARDVLEVIAWARADGRMFELFAESEDVDSGLGFTRTALRLTGFNPARGLGHEPADYLSDPEDINTVRNALDVAVPTTDP